ncbi:MAG: GAF domain-containing protein [Candidatus Eisenbacteria bacterium]|nr:GAF domain-containing protein [Candidatus Eisenbacteria bacterium]
MNPILPRRGREAASLDAWPGAAPGQVLAILGLFDRLTDHDALGRALVSLAVHPEGAGFAQAWLLVWRPQRGVLELRRGAKAARRAAPLAESIEVALRGRLEVEPSARDPQAGDHVLTPERLHGAPARVWGAGAPEGDDPPAGLPWSGAGVLDAVVLQRGGRRWGLLVGRWAAEPAEERRAALAGIGALAAHAADAIASAHQSRRRAQQAAALAQAARATVSALNLAEALQLIAKLAAQGTAARGSALWLAGAEGPPRLEVTQGPAGRRERTGRSLQHLAAQAVESGQARVLDDVTDEALLSPGAAAELGALALFPCVAFGRVLAALAVYDPAGVEPGEAASFDLADLEFLGALADLVASAADQARRFDELQHAAQQRRELAAQLRREERLAALGELAARMVRDARNPLASIAAFARRVHRALGASDPNREYLEIVIRESDRLEKLARAKRWCAAACGS